MAIAYKTHPNNSSSEVWTVSTYQTRHGDRVSLNVTKEVKEDSNWLIATVTISNVTENDSGYYDCIAASFADFTRSTSKVQYYKGITCHCNPILVLALFSFSSCKDC